MEVTPQMGICVRFCYKTVLKSSRYPSSLKRSPFIYRETLPMHLHNNHEIARNYLVKQAATEIRHSSRGKRPPLKPLLLLIIFEAPCKKGKENIFCNRSGLNSRAFSQHAK